MGTDSADALQIQALRGAIFLQFPSGGDELDGFKPSSFGACNRMSMGIACQSEFPRTELLAAAKKLAATKLTRFEQNDFYLGFIGAHDGRNAAFIFVSGRRFG
jgi:hypothetical protein